MTSLIGGFKDKTLESRSKVEPSTTQYIGRYRQGLDTLAQVAYAEVTTDTAESNSTQILLVATGIESTARVGDLVLFTSGPLSGDIAFIQVVAADQLVLSQRLAESPRVGDGFTILRPSFLKTDADGALEVAVTTSMPLPVGAATAALQTTGNASLSSIDTKTPALGQALMSASTPVTIASDQSTINVKGAFAIGTGADNPVRIGFTDFALGTVTSPDTIDFGGITYPLILMPDPDLNFLDYTPNGELRCHCFSPDNTEANARYALVNSAGAVAVDATRQQTILFASIEASSSGDNILVAADATRKIKVISYAFVCASTVNVRWKSGAATNLSGAMPFIANTGIAPGVSSPSQGAILQTAVNEALVLNLSGAVSVAGHLSYFLEA